MSWHVDVRHCPPPCRNELKVEENTSVNYTCGQSHEEHESLGQNVFRKTPDDEKLMSVEDIHFLKIIDEEFTKDEDIRAFVEKGFYIDDGLASVSTRWKVTP
jgi:hypothetical protein